MKNKITIIIAIFSAILGVFLVMTYITSIEEEVAIDSNVKSVVAAKKNIPQYSLVTPDMLKIVQVPAKYMQPKSIVNIKELLDQNDNPKFVTLVPIMEDEVILLTKLTIPGKETGLAVVIASGQRAISIPVDDATISGLLMPGNRIDLIATFDNKSVYLLQNIMVLSVGDKIVGEVKHENKNKRGMLEEMAETMSGTSITLSVKPKEALKIAYAMDKCTFNIVLRSPVDNSVKPIFPVNEANLFGPVRKKTDIEVIKGADSVREIE